MYKDTLALSYGVGYNFSQFSGPVPTRKLAAEPDCDNHWNHELPGAENPLPRHHRLCESARPLGLFSAVN